MVENAGLAGQIRTASDDPPDSRALAAGVHPGTGQPGLHRQRGVLMPDLATLTGLAQREIERLFAGLANQYPLYTVQNCGWLQPEIIRDEQVRKYWELLRSNVNPNSPARVYRRHYREDRAAFQGSRGEQ